MGALIAICVLLAIIAAICAVCTFASNECQIGSTFAIAMILFAVLGHSLSGYNQSLHYYKTQYEASQQKVELLQDSLSDARVRTERLSGELKVLDLRLQVEARDGQVCSDKLENISKVLEK